MDSAMLKRIMTDHRIEPSHDSSLLLVFHENGLTTMNSRMESEVISFTYTDKKCFHHYETDIEAQMFGAAGVEMKEGQSVLSYDTPILHGAVLLNGGDARAVLGGISDPLVELSLESEETNMLKAQGFASDKKGVSNAVVEIRNLGELQSDYSALTVKMFEDMTIGPCAVGIWVNPTFADEFVALKPANKAGFNPSIIKAARSYRLNFRTAKKPGQSIDCDMTAFYGPISRGIETYDFQTLFGEFDELSSISKSLIMPPSRFDELLKLTKDASSCLLIYEESYEDDDGSRETTTMVGIARGYNSKELPLTIKSEDEEEVAGNLHFVFGYTYPIDDDEEGLTDSEEFTEEEDDTK